MSEPVRFLLNGQRIDVGGLSPLTTLLEYLREVRRLTGTKEGCAEGDCGAGTVVLAEPAGDRLAWKPVNACIRLLRSADCKAAFTVESLAGDDGIPHPLQRALVASHASQCGFCTPGFAMSLFGLYKNAQRPDRHAIEVALSGNLCRCAGYRPIVEVALSRHDWRYLGLIGSKSKRAQFERRLAARGFGSEAMARIHCPIGTAGVAIRGKHPGSIAIAAEIPAVRETAARLSTPHLGVTASRGRRH